MRGEIAKCSRHHDDQTTHGRRAHLGVVPARAVVADWLADALGPLPADESRGADQRSHHGQSAGQHHRYHRLRSRIALSSSARSSNGWISPAIS